MGKPLEILNVKGRGHYVGTVFSVVQVGAGWFGEGDDFFYVDGKKKPTSRAPGPRTTSTMRGRSASRRARTPA
jgi:hypothetical protein